jgi:hypothetical protein
MVLDLQKRPLGNTLYWDMWCVDIWCMVREACQSFCFLTVSGALTVWQVQRARCLFWQLGRTEEALGELLNWKVWT